MKTHDTPSELRARSMLSSLKIPYQVYKTFDRLEWRCPRCLLQSDVDSANKPDPDRPNYVVCRHCEIEMPAMKYETDILAWKIDACEIRGKIHEKGIHVKYDMRREAFLSQRYGLRFHNFSNDTLLKHPEEFEQYFLLLKELREK